MNKAEIKDLMRKRKSYNKELKRLHAEHERYLKNMCAPMNSFETDESRHKWIIHNANCLSSIEKLEAKTSRINKKYIIIEQALNELPYEDAQIIKEFYVEGYTLTKVAMKFSYSEGGMKKKIEKAFDELVALVTVFESSQAQSFFPYGNVYKVVDGYLVKCNSNCIKSNCKRVGFKDLKKEGWLPLKIVNPLPKESEYYGRVREEYKITEDYIEVNYVVCE